jgi:uncharacterized protein (TIGR03435 family)
LIRHLGKAVFVKSGLPAVVAMAAWIIIGMSSAPLMQAQQPVSSFAFEAASVRPNNSPDFQGRDWQFLPGGRFAATNTPLSIIIALAFNVPMYTESLRLLGGPPWIRSDRYDIQATGGTGTISAGMSVKARDDKVRLMLQDLLADRFKLVVRREIREVPAYVVVVAKNGPKLRKAAMDEKDCPQVEGNNGVSCHSAIGGQGNGIHGRALSVADVLAFAENWSDRPIIDQTGIEGLFEVDTEGWMPLRPRIVPPGRQPTAEDIAMSDPTRPTLFRILDTLGLKMESRKFPVETFVIDHIEKPTEN